MPLTTGSSNVTPSAAALPSFSNPQSLYDELRPRRGLGLAPVLLLRSSWFEARAAKARACTTAEDRARLALPRRQELLETEPEAFFSADEVQALGVYQPPFLSGTTQVPVVSVSYCWETPDHPDPRAETMICVADTIQRWRERHSSWDDPPEEVAIFFDWVSICQKGPDGTRTRPELAAFKQALGRMQLWYAHQSTVVLLMTQQNEGSTAPPYEARGWPNFERACAMLGKPAFVSAQWLPIIDVSVPDLECPRLAPVTPEMMRALLADKKFTNGADREVVLKLYTDTARAVIGGAEKLFFTGLGLDDTQLRVLCDGCRCARRSPICISVRMP